MRLRVVPLTAVLLVHAVLPRQDVRAAFHQMSIVEVFPGTAAAPNAQFVELQMWAGGQNVVDGHPVTFYNAANTLVATFSFAGNVANGANQATILIATAQAQTLFGVTPDLVMTSAAISAAGGKVCFDGIDCVAWGSYAGPSTGVGTPFNVAGGLTLGRSIHRRLDIAGSPTVLDAADDTGDSANDFVLGFASPRNNAGTLAHAVSVDVAANRRSIDPLIYGVHFASAAALLDLNATINRYGGNSAGRYNWELNVDNRGSDYFFANIPYASAAPGELGDSFIAASKAGGAEPFLTMPMVGWVPSSRDYNSSFSVAKYGAFTAADGDRGNGCKASIAPVPYHPCGGAAGPFTGNDPNDAAMPANAAFQQGWMQYVRDTWGPGNAGGLRYWGLDNEPSIWHVAYWDVHPQGASTAEMTAKMIDYGSRIKTVDPTAQVLGPEEWGWDGFFYSGKDLQLLGPGTCGGANCPDHVAQGGMDYVPYLIEQMRQYEIANGQRILDYLSLHFYPQGNEFVGNPDDVTMATQQQRNRSTRGLWDPSYVNESYIGTQVQLIPRMKAWAAAYPGTKTALTEYNWGAENHINGATTQADLLGIFGREGLDMAIRWTDPVVVGSPAYNAFKMYRNYDGAQSSFGDTSVSTSVPNPDDVAAFAAQRTASGALTIMVISKVLSGSTATTINLANFTASGAAQAWRLTSTNTITQLADVTVSGNSMNATLPPQSITLFVVPGVGLTAPSVTTQAATSVSQTGATLNASVNPNGSATSADFEYGTTLAYGSTTASAGLGAGGAPVATDSAVGGLACGTLYHFRGRASNAGGTTNGADLTFTTSGCPPSVTTQAATSLSQAGATLNASINPKGSATSAVFDYGTTIAYGTTTSPASLGSGSAPVMTSSAVISLTCNTLYHFRGRATNASGTTNGGDLTFTTSACPAPAPREYVSVNGNDTNTCSNPATPCRTFVGAITQVTPGGEVVVLNSGTFGGGTITKSVTINAPAGVAALVATPLVVNAGANDVVTLRGLTFVSPTVGSGTALTFSGGAGLNIENTVIHGWSTGLSFAVAGKLNVTNSVVRDNAVDGIYLSAASGAIEASIEGSRLLSNGNGLRVRSRSKAAIKDSVVSGNSVGLLASSLDASPSELDVEDCVVTHNTVTGVAADSLGTVRLSGSTVTNNLVGLQQSGSGALVSRGGNTIEGNGTDTSGTIGAYIEK